MKREFSGFVLKCRERKGGEMGWMMSMVMAMRRRLNLKTSHNEEGRARLLHDRWGC